MKFGKGTADKAGRAMKNRTPDKMGRAMVKKMAMGGPTGREPLPRDEDLAAADLIAARKAARANQGMKRGMGMKKGGMAKSDGSYRKAADGVAHKGKTKGKMVKMMRGGYCG